MAKKLTITDILAQKEAAKNKKPKILTLYVESIDAEITIQEPSKALIMESAELGGEQSDNHIIYHCMVDPNLKDNHKSLMEHFQCATPFEIVESIFKIGEIPAIARHILSLAGYSMTGSNVQVVNEIKNS